MSFFPSRPQQSPATWINRRALVERWLKRSVFESALVQLLGGMFLMVAGLIALAFTSYVIIGVLVLVLFDMDRFASLRGPSALPFHPIVTGGLFTVIVAGTFIVAWRRRGDRKFLRLTDSKWEFVCAGPILLIMAAEDLHTFVRLMRLDLAPVAQVLLWVFDKQGRATFDEIADAFPGLNLVRVLPQLRDLPGVNPWTDEGVIGLFEDLREELAALLGEGAKPPPEEAHRAGPAGEWEPPPPRNPLLTEEVIAWYRTLELPPFAAMPQVKKQYKKLVKIYHPDANPGNRAAGGVPNDEQIKRINIAYHKILKHSQEHANVQP